MLRHIKWEATHLAMEFARELAHLETLELRSGIFLFFLKFLNYDLDLYGHTVFLKLLICFFIWD